VTLPNFQRPSDFRPIVRLLSMTSSKMAGAIQRAAPVVAVGVTRFHGGVAYNGTLYLAGQVRPKLQRRVIGIDPEWVAGSWGAKRRPFLPLRCRPSGAL